MFGRRILKNTGVQVIGKLIAIGLSFATLSLTVRYLGPEQYGVLATVTVFLSFFAVISDLGLSLFGLRELSQSKRDARTILSSLLTLRLVISVVSIALAWVIGSILGYSQSLLIGVLLMSPTLMFNTATSAVQIYFQHNLHMRYVVTGEVIAKAVTLAGLIYIVNADLGLNAFYVLNVVGAAAFTLAVYIAARSHIKLTLSFNFAYWKTALLLSVPLGLAAALNSIYYRLDTILLSLLDLSNSIVPSISNFEAVGLYQVPYRLIEVVMIFPGLFITSVFPVLAAQALIDDVWKVRAQRAYDFLIMLAVPLVLFVWVFAPQIIQVIAGRGYEVSADLLKVLIVAVAISFLNAMLGFLLVARNREADILKLAIFTITTNLLVNLILIPRLSFYAAPYTSLLSEFGCLVISLWYVNRRFKFMPAHGVVIKSAAAAMVASLIVLWVPPFATGPARNVFFVVAAAAIAYALVYAALLVPFKAVNISEVRETLRGGK